MTGKFNHKLDRPQPEPLFTVYRPTKQEQDYGAEYELPPGQLLKAMLVGIAVVGIGVAVIVGLARWLMP